MSHQHPSRPRRESSSRIARLASHGSPDHSLRDAQNPILQLQSALGNGGVARLIQARRTPQSMARRGSDAASSAGTALAQRDSKYAPARVRDKWAKEKSEGGKKEEAPEEGPSLFPAVEAVSKTISAVKNIAGVVQELTHNSTATGRVQLPPMVGGGKGADYKPMYDLERIFTYMMAQEICNQAFKIGMMHGIDFRLIGPDGRPNKNPQPPKPATSTAGPPSPAPVAPAPVVGPAQAPTPAQSQAPAPAQPDSEKGATNAAKAGQWDEESVKALTSQLSGLQDLAASALKNKVKSELETRITAQEVVPKAHFFWDAKDHHGTREMTEMDRVYGNLSGAWGSFSASVVVEYVNNADGGMPDDVGHFGLVADHQKLSPHWVTGGAIDWKTHNDLDIDVSFTTQPHMYKPEGAYMVHTAWKWDESTSIMDCFITPYGLRYTGLADLKLSGDEPDDGWF